ncbi:hypothetical protein [Phaffia rhodozyma]|uniref:Uncharacterized protein n=1 Tax=Phaffia rhodozyma TaxID=264483 RepID=A0A0F7SG00_PHARH|nr:hypothetical protein [Phaffia rhodozyma]
MLVLETNIWWFGFIDVAKTLFIKCCFIDNDDTTTAASSAAAVVDAAAAATAAVAAAARAISGTSSQCREALAAPIT